MKLTRREIREKALQTLFQVQGDADFPLDTAIEYALLSEQEEVKDKESEEAEVSVSVPDYLQTLVSGVIEHQEKIDQMITSHLRNWSISRLAKTDLLILRIAVYELMFQKDLHASVVMDEAIEITKMYSDEKSRKFVNGVLSNVNDTVNKKVAE